MVVDFLVLGRACAAVSGGLALALGIRVRSTSTGPAARTFTVLLGALGCSGLALGLIAAERPAYNLLWLLAYLTIPVAFALFSFDYYGLDYLTSRSRLAAFLLPVGAAATAGVLATVATPASGPTMGAAATGGGTGLEAVVLDVARAVREVGLYYASGVIIVATALVLGTVYRYDHLDAGLGLTLSAVGVWPWGAYLVAPELAATVDYGIGITLLGVGYVASIAAAGLAYGPYDLFGSMPAAGNVGPATVLDSMDDAVLVVDGDGSLLRANAVARRRFDLVEREVVGAPLASVLGVGLDRLAGADPVDLATVEGVRQFAATTSPILGRGGGRRGHAVVLRDVTRRRTREQRLQVLNRVLRHNLRNDLTVIRGQAELIAEGEEVDAGDRAEQIRSAADGLVETGDLAREIEETLSRPGLSADPTDVGAAVSAVVSGLEADHPDVTFTTAVPDGAATGADDRVLRTILRNAVGNACEHNDADEPIVVISVDRRADGSVLIAVSDNGPGIPEMERAAIAAGTERPLEHGTGLGLWAIHWGVTHAGGELSFAENNPRGTTVRIALPAPAEETTVAMPAGAAAD